MAVSPWILTPETLEKKRFWGRAWQLHGARL